jgi:hypothetical protein
MDGRLLIADKPVVVLGWPASSSMTSFETRMAAWNYVEVASRQDKSAIHARVFEHVGNEWRRIPPFPTYLQKIEEARLTSMARPQVRAY